VTPSWGDSGFSLEPRTREERKPTWPRLAGLGAILVLAFVVGKGCQDRDVQLDQDEAVEIAREQVDFTPTYTQVRLLRQGINRKAYWFVSLSIPIGFDGDRPDLFDALAVIKIDSKTGQVVENKQQDPEETKKARQEAAERDQDDLVEEKLQGVGEQ
jgi:hypothetical protein